MAAFAVVAPADNYLLQSVLERNFPRRYYMAPGQWVVAESGVTAQQVAERIGISGAAGQFVVFSIAGHYGYYRNDLWEWLKINSG